MLEPFVHPQFDPIALWIGPLPIRWYGLMYLLAFLTFFVLGRRQILKSIQPNNITYKNLDDLMVFGI
jgi:phosphatidylglycerol:prolipoprotein diacylglycerol transferase